MRKLADVIDQILEISINEEMNKLLNKIKFNCGFTAPEAMGIRWEQTADVLSAYIDRPLDDEGAKIMSIFTTLSENEVREKMQCN